MDRVAALNTRMHQKGITVTALARAAGVHRVTVSRFLNRHRTCQWGTMERLMHALWGLEHKIEGYQRGRNQGRWPKPGKYFQLFWQREG